MDLKRRAIEALPAYAGPLPGGDIYHDPDLQSIPSPSMVGPAQGVPNYNPTPPSPRMQGVAPTPTPRQAVPGVGLGMAEANGRMEALPQRTTSINGRFRKVATDVRSSVASQRRGRYIGFAKDALPWAGSAFVITMVLIITLRPSFVYARSDELTAPQFSLTRLAVLSAVVGFATFCTILYGFYTTML